MTSKAGTGAASWGPVVMAWLLLSLLTTAPYVRAFLAPPPGTAFLGFFYFVDDQYNYLSYVEQAERGAFFFENKLLLEPHPPRLLNLEWWLVGRVSAALGGRPFLAGRLLALGAGLALLAGIDRWLRAAGLPDSHRFPALLLVGMGGGLGGPAWRAGLLPLPQAVDLTTGLFPFVEQLGNAHFVAGTALLTWTLHSTAQASHPAAHIQGILLGTVLGLVRPYDLMLLVAARGIAVVVTEGPARGIRRLAPLLGLLPVAAYDGWVFFGRPDFRSFGLTYVAPPMWALFLALGPALALAALSARASVPTPATRTARIHLGAWAAVVMATVLLRPVGFALQFLVGLGAPLLALGALAMARWRPSVTLALAVPFAGTALVALGLVLGPNPRWYPPADRMAAAWSLRKACKPGDTALTPPDIGLYAAGLTACKALASHPVAPDYTRRDAEVRAFYGATDPAARHALLDRYRIAHLVLPGDPGLIPRQWLGEATPFRRVTRLDTLSLYTREPSGSVSSSP